MSSPVNIRVTLDGKAPKFELMIDGFKARDLTRAEVLELALNATSAMRWTWPENKSAFG